MARFLSMKDFADKASARKCEDEKVEVKMGQIIGHVTHVTKKDGILPDGTPKVSLAAHGEFEAINYRTGELLQSGCIYLPDYYAQELQHALDAADGGALLFGVELSIRPTGKAIPFSWNVTNVTGRARSNPLEGLKRLMASAGTLKVSPPMDREQARMIADTMRELSGADAATRAPVIEHAPRAAISYEAPTPAPVDTSDIVKEVIGETVDQDGVPIEIAAAAAAEEKATRKAHKAHA